MWVCVGPSRPLPDPPAGVPVLSVTGGDAIVEGHRALFTIIADPAPTSPLRVGVAVTQNGDWDASGARTITVAGAVTTYRVATLNDPFDEPDGSVTITVQPETGYTVSATAGSASVTVIDDDPAP